MVAIIFDRICLYGNRPKSFERVTYFHKRIQHQNFRSIGVYMEHESIDTKYT